MDLGFSIANGRAAREAASAGEAARPDRPMATAPPPAAPFDGALAAGSFHPGLARMIAVFSPPAAVSSMKIPFTFTF